MDPSQCQFEAQTQRNFKVLGGITVYPSNNMTLQERPQMDLTMEDLMKNNMNDSDMMNNEASR